MCELVNVHSISFVTSSYECSFTEVLNHHIYFYYLSNDFLRNHFKNTNWVQGHGRSQGQRQEHTQEQESPINLLKLLNCGRKLEDLENTSRRWENIQTPRPKNHANRASRTTLSQVNKQAFL